MFNVKAERSKQRNTCPAKGFALLLWLSLRLGSGGEGRCPVRCVVALMQKETTTFSEAMLVLTPQILCGACFAPHPQPC